MTGGVTPVNAVMNLYFIARNTSPNDVSKQLTYNEMELFKMEQHISIIIPSISQ